MSSSWAGLHGVVIFFCHLSSFSDSCKVARRFSKRRRFVLLVLQMVFAVVRFFTFGTPFVKHGVSRLGHADMGRYLQECVMAAMLLAGFRFVKEAGLPFRRGTSAP
ncbi:hypothetical protein DVU_0623 [Nitratidesulfovibrio vulgaris str. Hildenborough]|uniref:Uncharacterized protein n=1 Tax=Nitratidesulfovibrio vulgaris (strain ATCC 29579 / DSM 644 / CCUG 34227 / NCIMB 8303 / VKM B-1760 / Hildenborough) TaxID=882 RepID=Q72EF5_NITV2|nr:hypothetical protein DVU_0623 [Nitratidesulfovibrio vulgaris str. Hildenborough]